MITKTQWDTFKKQLREVRKTNAVIYTKATEELYNARRISHENKVIIPTYGNHTNKLSVLSVPMDDDKIYLSQGTELTRELFSDLKALHDMFYIERNLDEYINDITKRAINGNI
jgi:hypothetical protein